MLQQTFVSSFLTYNRSRVTKTHPVTILAFIYVPLDLATSIFGMNIQQLNQNGQNLRVFLVTAAVALLITVLIWLACYLYLSSEAKVWLRAATESQKQIRDSQTVKRHKFPNGDLTKPVLQYTLSTRLAMILWLILNGHTIWMSKSGAWLAILLNYQRPIVLSFVDEEGVEFNVLPLETACDHVTRHSRQRPIETSLNPRDRILKDMNARYDCWPTFGRSGSSHPIRLQSKELTASYR